MDQNNGFNNEQNNQNEQNNRNHSQWNDPQSNNQWNGQQGGQWNGQQGGQWNGQQGGNPWGYNQNGYVPPITNTPFDQQKPQKDSSTAQTLGIVGLILALICSPLVGIILGIMAITRAKSSSQLLGYELPEAKTGRICGIIAIIAAIANMILNFVVLSLGGFWMNINF